MRCVICLSEEPVQYLVKSTPDLNKKFVLRTTDDLDKAEIWTDPEAARAWCLTKGYHDAHILQIDAPVIVRPTELRRLEPKVKELSPAERTAMKAFEPKPEPEAAEEPAPRRQAPKKRGRKAATAKPDTSAEEAQAMRELERLERAARA